MNFYGSVVVQHEKNERQYLMVIPLGTPFEEAHAACLELAEGVLEMQKQQKEAAEKAAAEAEASKAEEAADKAPEVVDVEVVMPEVTD